MQYLSNDLKQAIKNCLDQDKGLQVFKYYGFEPNNHKPQRENPFRQERTSSFFVNWYKDAFRFKDFGDNEAKGNAWDFLKRIEGLSDNQAVWERLAEIYNLAYSNQTALKSLPKLAKKTTFTPENDSKATLTHIAFRDFTPAELDFWQKKGQIDLPTLEKYGVKVVQSFELAYPQPTGEAKIWKKDNLKFIFAFEIVAGKVYKLYQPKELYRAYGKSKTSYLPNLAHAKEVLGENYRYAFGLDTLRENEPAILCGGEADCLALLAKGYNAFTMGAEEAKIPAFIAEKLAGKQIDFKTLRVLYDTDFTGYKHSQLLKKAYKTPILTLPKLALQKEKHLPKPAENDLCDYVGKFGWDSDLEICLAKKPFSKRGFTLPTVPQFKVEKYLGAYKEVITSFFLQNTKIQLAGDAGLGKTHTLLREIAPEMPNPVLFLVPYSIQVSQIEEEYKDLGHLLTCFQNKASQEDEELHFSQINVCTYDRAKQLFDKNPDFEVWIDESHLLTLAYPYRRQAIDHVLAIMEASPRAVMLSATPDYQFVRKEDYQLISFQRKNNPVFEVTRLAYQKREERNQLLGGLLSKGKSNGITVVRINDKKLALSYRDTLVKMGIYKREEIDFVFSMEEKNYHTKTHASLIKEGLIPEGIKLLFVSACFDCGINVYNQNITRLILFDMQSHDNSLDVAVQVSQRFRNMQKMELVIIKREKPTCLPDAQQAFYKRERQTQAFGELQLQNIRLAHQKYQQKMKYCLEKAAKPSYLKINTDLSKMYQVLQWNRKKQDFELNKAYLRCTNEVFLQENLGITEFYEWLAQEISIVEMPAQKEAENPAENGTFHEKLKAAHAEQKERMEKSFVNLLPELATENQQAFFETLHAQTKDIQLKEKILAQTPASLQNIKAQIKTNLVPVSASMEEAMEVGAKHTLSKRYFYLKELLFSPAENQRLLQNNIKEHQFQTLTREIGNHIKLKAYDELGEDVWVLAQDTILREEIQNLAFLRHTLACLPKAAPKEQKRSDKHTKQVEALQAALKSIEKEEKAMQAELKALETTPKTKTLQKKAMAKLQTIRKKGHRVTQQLEKTITQQTKSHIDAWELNELNAYLNALRGKAPQQHLRLNLRLVESLCHTQNFRKKTWDEASQTYQIKQYIHLKGMKNLEEVLTSFGLAEEEALSYQNRLSYQIQTDVSQYKQNLLSQNLSENIGKVHRDTIVNYIQPKQIVLNEKGYPMDWD